MAENTKIEWTDNSWNPWIGCEKVSPGCKFCYAETQMTRNPKWANTWGPASTTARLRTSEANWQKPLQWQRKAEKQNARFKVFCASLADVFEDNVELIDWRLDLFENLIAQTPDLDWQILTKRPEVARQFFGFRPDLLMDNVWIGTSVEDQATANERIPELLRIPARLRFLSVEPQLEDIQIAKAWEFLTLRLSGLRFTIDWLIIGGESGSQARPFELIWATNLIDYCQDNGIPCFMKQVGSRPRFNGNDIKLKDKKGGDPAEWPETLRIRQFPE